MFVPASTIAQVRPLSDDQQAFFKRHGYAVLRGSASQQVGAALLAAAQGGLASTTAPMELEIDVGYADAPFLREAGDGRTVRRLLDTDSRDMSYTKWARDPHMAATIAQPIDGPVYLSFTHYSCVMTKHSAFGTATHWHHDSRYWSLERNELVSSWPALVEEIVDSGCLWVISGSHGPDLPADWLDTKLFLRQELPENRALIDTARPVPLLPGDVLLFHCSAFYAARANQTAAVKSSAVSTYCGLDNYPLPSTRSSARPGPLAG